MEAERELDRKLCQRRDLLNKEEEESSNEGRRSIWYIRENKIFKTETKLNEKVYGKPTEKANGKSIGKSKIRLVQRSYCPSFSAFFF